MGWTDGTTSPEPLPHLHRGETLQHNLLWAVDLTTPPSKAVLVALAEACADKKHAATMRYLGSRDGRAAYKCDVTDGHPTIVQLLQRFDSCKPEIGRLLELLGPLRPRPYSLANTCAPSTDGAQGGAASALECAYKVVEYQSHWGTHGGVATSWLEREAQAHDESSGGKNSSSQPRTYFPVTLRPSTGFRPPEDASKPIIMIGPGTGVAPFRGFLQHRQAQAAAGAELGESWLFFGNWRREQDFLYQEDFEAFAADGTLTHLVTAWSRETDKKVCGELPCLMCTPRTGCCSVWPGCMHLVDAAVSGAPLAVQHVLDVLIARAVQVYVQHKMQEHAKALCAALHDDEGYAFVCGDGLHMAADVHAALKKIIQDQASFDADEADAFLKDLSAQKRYMKDVWM